MKKNLLFFVLLCMILPSCTDNVPDDCLSPVRKVVMYGGDKSDSSFIHVLSALETLYSAKFDEINSGKEIVRAEFYTHEIPSYAYYYLHFKITGL